jgi:hypothetical protein
MDDRHLSHEYDAIKRREYYLKNRKLKGHQKIAVEKPGSRAKAAVELPAKTRQQRQEERRRQLESQVNALKGRLEKLRAALAELTKQAKLRSGQKPSKTPDKKTSEKKSTGNAKPKQTASQKAAAAKQSKEYYEKNKDQLLADEVKSLTDKIKTIQERIAKMHKTSSVGAKNTQSK